MTRLLALLIALAAPAAAEDVEVELVLLADASGSITESETRFQRQGYAAAITDPRVLSAIDQSTYGKIALTYVEWAAAGTEHIVVPWTIIDGPQSAHVFAAALLSEPKRAFGRNSIGAALITGRNLIEENDIDGWRKVIDFSGDSARNYTGPSIAEGRAVALAAGITINGLPIACIACTHATAGPSLAAVYEERIIGGNAAFVLTADNGESLADAIRRKLVLEISGTLPERSFAAISPAAAPPGRSGPAP